MYTQSSKAKKKKEVKGTLVTESFQLYKAKRKLEKDIEYFNYLNENFVDDVFKDQYKLLLEGVLNDTIKLYQECDVTPRLISPTLDSVELSENQIVDIYKTNLNAAVKDNYTKPLLSGKITELYENEIKELTKKLITEGSNLDMEQVRIYMPFEETLYQFNKSVLIPDIAQMRVDAFVESTTAEYLEFIEESAEEILKDIQMKMKLLTSMIAPNMFDASVEAEGVDAPKMAGITIAVDKNFDDDEEEELEGSPEAAIGDDDEAATELFDDNEASELEDEDDDIDGVEINNEVEYDIPAPTEDESIAQDFVAEENAEGEDVIDAAAEETVSDKLNNELEVTDIETNDAAITQTDSSNFATNDADIPLQGEGEDHGEDIPTGAQLPGSVPAEGEVEADVDAGINFNNSNPQVSVSSEEPEDALQPSEEDVSESDDKNELEEGTTQDKQPKGQVGKVGVKKTGSLPGGGTKQDKRPKGQGKGGTEKANKLASSTTVQDKKPKGQGDIGSQRAGTLPGGGTTQDTNI
jgi:hypothetical protein